MNSLKYTLVKKRKESCLCSLGCGWTRGIEMDLDGLNSLEYTLMEKRRRKMFVLLRVQLDKRD